MESLPRRRQPAIRISDGPNLLKAARCPNVCDSIHFGFFEPTRGSIGHRVAMHYRQFLDISRMERESVLVLRLGPACTSAVSDKLRQPQHATRSLSQALTQITS